MKDTHIPSGLFSKNLIAFAWQANIAGNELKAEYLPPIYIGKLLREDKIFVKVLETADQWFDITYQADNPAVVNAFKRLIQMGIYQSPLYE